MKKTTFILAVAMLVMSAATLLADTIPIEDIKKITAESSENIKSEKVIKMLLQPGKVIFKRTKGWAIYPVGASELNKEGDLIMTDKNAAVMFADYEMVKPPQPRFNTRVLNKYTHVGKPNYALVKAHVAQRPDEPSEYFAVLASKKEFFIYTIDKHTYFADLESLDIKLSPALFFSYGKDGDKCINILVVDEDEVPNLHTGNVKTAIFKFYPAEMKISATGAIKSEKKLYKWKGKREDD